MKNKKIVNPNLYSRNYFLTDNEGCNEYSKGLDKNIHPKFKKALEIANPKKGDVVLDIGCGRGELIYYCVKRGAKVLGIDYSKEGIDIAKETIRMLPQDLQNDARAEIGDVVTRDFHERYDLIFMIEIAEHMYDWQLEKTFSKIKEILKDNGRLVIITPNYYYEKYLSPIKNLINIPWNIIKWPLRVLRGRYRPKDRLEIFSKIFKIRVDRGELNRKMHVNITTRKTLKKLLQGFDVKVWCEDRSKNIISLLTQKWWGRDIIAVVSL